MKNLAQSEIDEAMLQGLTIQDIDDVIKRNEAQAFAALSKDFADLRRMGYSEAEIVEMRSCKRVGPVYN
jgi:hypothetical protein